MSSRLALVESDSNRAVSEIEESLAILKDQNFPLVAWRVHQTAAEIYQKVGSTEKVTENVQARNTILRRFADSFDHDEPLRSSILREVEAVPR